MTFLYQILHSSPSDWTTECSGFDLPVGVREFFCASKRQYRLRVPASVCAKVTGGFPGAVKLTNTPIGCRRWVCVERYPFSSSFALMVYVCVGDFTKQREKGCRHFSSDVCVAFIVAIKGMCRRAIRTILRSLQSADLPVYWIYLN